MSPSDPSARSLGLGGRAFGLTVLAMATSLPAARGDDPAADAPLGVLSFNIRYDNPADGDNAWPRRRDWVGQIVGDARVDIAALQEALYGQVTDLAARLPAFAWHGVGRDDGQRGGEFAPIFYRTGRIELLDGGTFWLSATPDVAGSRGWDARLPRIATWARLRDRRTGGELLAANAHLDHAGVEARRESARLLRRRLAEMAGGLPVVLTGDLNCLPGDEPCRILSEPAAAEGDPPAMVDALVASATGHVGPEATFNGFRELASGMRIDYIFVRGLAVRAHAILDQRREGRFASDHLPVFAEVTSDE